MPRLSDKSALITGASHGIGEAIARHFVAKGAHVWITDRDAVAGGALARELAKKARFARLDVAREEDGHRVLRVNLDGVFLGCRVAIQAMAPKGQGAIIKIASRAGHVGLDTGRRSGTERPD
ncbi:MAG: SDR family NAD(P)-dependent oxidoreductase [Alphaproteobacteria bacterium]